MPEPAQTVYKVDVVVNSTDMYKIVVFVPKRYVEEVKLALFDAGAGQFRNYDWCAWQTAGTGQFRPNNTSQPFIGVAGRVEHVEEYRIEMICRNEYVRDAITALREVHPYEEPAYEIYPIWQYPDLPDDV